MDDNAIIARHGWAALLKLLVAKGVITQDESMGVVSAAHEGARMNGMFGAGADIHQGASSGRHGSYSTGSTSVGNRGGLAAGGGAGLHGPDYGAGGGGGGASYGGGARSPTNAEGGSGGGGGAPQPTPEGEPITLYYTPE